MHGNAADGMKDVRNLAGFHAYRDWHLQVESSAVHIWLHLVSLVWRKWRHRSARHELL